MFKIILFIVFFACSSSTKDVKIVSLNVKNYISKNKGYFEKTLKSRHSLAKFLAEQEADILVLNELEEPVGREDLQGLLSYYQQEYPFVYVTDSLGKRDLVILSKIKAVDIISEPKILINVKGQKRYLSRGFLAVEFSRGNYNFTIVSGHLKSKRLNPLGSDNIRYEEVKKFVSFLKELDRKRENLIICGDFNDDYNSKVIKYLRKYYKLLKLVDKRGELWTYFYRYQQVYSRFDYIFTNESMRKEVHRYQIIDDDYRNISDHRATSVLISPFDRK